MNLSLVDELTMKQAQKFQVNKFDSDFLDQTLSGNAEGILNLDWEFNYFGRTGKDAATSLMNYLTKNYEDYNFEMDNENRNYGIMFRKIGDKK